MSKRLLIIGAGLEQIPAYELARQMGLYVVATDMNPCAPAFKYADDCLVASTRDVQATWKAVLEYNAQKPINGVMTIANDVPLTVASVAAKLKLPGIPVISARWASNKLLMKKRFASHNVPTPAFFPVKTKKNFLFRLAQIRYPAILKPSDSRGSRGVLLLDEKIDPGWAWRYSQQFSESGVLLLEKFAEGPQLSVEGVFLDQRYIPIAFGDRNYDNFKETRPYLVEDGGIIPSRFNGRILLKISALIERAAFSLGISWGSVKADIALTKEGPVILELAARLSGNYLATHHIPWAYGIDIVSALIRLSLGEELKYSDLTPKHKRYLGVRYFFPPAGRIKRISGVGRVKRLKYVRMLRLYKKPGDYQGRITDHTKRAGTIICAGYDYSSAKKRVEAAVNKIKFEVVKNLLE